MIAPYSSGKEQVLRQQDFPSLILQDAGQKHGTNFPNRDYNPRLHCSFVITSVEELAWTPVHKGLDSLDWSWI